MNRTSALLAPALLAIVTLAFGVAPFVTPPFKGFDPALFPFPIGRPSIQPAGYAFSIWGVIYLWLFAHAGYGLVKRAHHPAWARVRWPLILSIAIGSVWLYIAGLNPVIATVTIALMAGSAIAAFLRADAATDRWLLSAPLAIYAGWLSAAAFVSLGVNLTGFGWLGDTASAALMLGLSVSVAVGVQMRQPAMPVYGLTVIWAQAAIIAVNWRENWTVVALAASSIAILALTLLQPRSRRA